MNVHFRPPELDQPRYKPTTREERIPNLRDSIQRNSSSSSSSDEDGSSFEDSFEQMMENWADDDPLVLDQTGKLLSSATSGHKIYSLVIDDISKAVPGLKLKRSYGKCFSSYM